MFIIASIENVIKNKFSYNNKATKIELKNTIIKLPVSNEKIDFDFMESFIKELKTTHIKKDFLWFIKRCAGSRSG